MGPEQPGESSDALDEAERAFEARLAARLDEPIEGDPADFFITLEVLRKELGPVDAPQADDGQPGE